MKIKITNLKEAQSETKRIGMSNLNRNPFLSAEKSVWLSYNADYDEDEVGIHILTNMWPVFGNPSIVKIGPFRKQISAKEIEGKITEAVEKYREKKGMKRGLFSEEVWH